MKDRVSWFALRTDDPVGLIRHIRAARSSDIRQHFACGDFESWLRDLYNRPDLAERVHRMRQTWNGEYVPRAELVALLESGLSL